MKDLAGLKVMIVDDSSTIVRAAEIYIQGPKDKPSGILTLSVDDGFTAIPKIKVFMPDIILLDVMMLRSDGYVICKAIKNNKQYKNIKVIMMTSKSGLFDKARGAEAKADDYIVKPFQKDVLLGMLAKHAPEQFQTI
jgi:twitching motility two-component system response regulator PilG